MNKAVILIISFFCISFLSCKKKTCDLQYSSIVASASEIAVIQNYLNANSLTATQHSSGLFYTIIEQGNSEYPNLCASVTVRYKGSLLDGSVFDESTSNVSFLLSNLIVAWQNGIPLLQKGGKIRLYVPPSLGYGDVSKPKIPANSTLIFDIDLIGFEN